MAGWGSGMDIYVLPDVECVAGGGRPCGVGGRLCALWLPGRVGWGGWEGGDAGGRRCGNVCICMAGSLCYRAGEGAPLWSNCTPVGMLKNNNNNYLLTIHYVSGTV